MQRLTNSFDGVSGQWSPEVIYWTKVKMLHLNCLPFICKMTQASKANESVIDWVTHKVKVYGYCQEETHESHLNVTGVQFFRLQIWTYY